KVNGAYLWSRLKVGDLSGEHRSLAHLPWIAKTSLRHKAQHPVFGIVFHALAGMKQAGKKTVCSALCALEVDHVKSPSRFEHAANRAKRFHLLLGRQMVKHK